MITLLYISLQPISTYNYKKQLQEVILLDSFKIEKDTEKISSINRTIRFKPEHFDKIMELSDKTGVSFNKIVTQCIEFALTHLEE